MLCVGTLQSQRELAARAKELGVDPPSRRMGIGGALLAPGLDASEQQRLPCALLTNTEETLEFYARHGFEVVGEIRARGCPTMWAMQKG